MEKRTIFAVILAALILFGYQLYVAKHYPSPDLGSTTGVESTIEDVKEPGAEYTIPEAKSEEL